MPHPERGGDAETRLPSLTRSQLTASAPALFGEALQSKPSTAASVPSRRGGLSDLNVRVSVGDNAHLGIINYSVARKCDSPVSKKVLSRMKCSSEASIKDPATICSRKWTTEPKRFLHEHRQRQWLLRKAKLEYIDFSNAERAELRRYFDALATDGNKITIDHLETMLISLGLAATRKEVRSMVSKIDTNSNGSLDFEEYLEIFRGRSDSEIFQVFKAMMEGKLGDPNLNFQTVISSHRRKHFIEATGARRMRAVRLPSDSMPVPRSEKLLRNFAQLMRARYNEAEAAAGNKADQAMADHELLPFDPAGGVPPGSLGIVWRDVTTELSLVPSRPSSAERSARALGSPPSPRAVIDAIIKGGKMKKRLNNYGGTVVIPAPALDEQKPPPSPVALRRRRQRAESLDVS